MTKNYAEERAALLGTGVVDQHLQRPDLGLDPVDHGVDLIGCGDVAGVGSDVEAFGKEDIRCCGQRDIVARVEHHGRSGLAEGARQCQADAATRSGDQRDATGEGEQVLHLHIMGGTAVARARRSAWISNSKVGGRW